MEWLGHGDVMASYKDYLSGKLKVTAANVSKAVSSMAAAANKRLKRLQEQGWKYIKADSERSEYADTIAGHKKFGAKGKSLQELFSEFKRLVDFFESGLSSVSEVRKQAKEFNIEASKLKEYVQMQEAKRYYENDAEQYVEYERPMTKREMKDLKQALKAEKTRADRMGYEFNEDENASREWYTNWINGLHLYNYLIENGLYKPSRVDSDQVRMLCDIIVAEHEDWSLEEMADWVLQQNAEYVNARRNRRRRRARDTSSFVYGRNL